MAEAKIESGIQFKGEVYLPENKEHVTALREAASDDELRSMKDRELISGSWSKKAVASATKDEDTGGEK